MTKMSRLSSGKLVFLLLGLLLVCSSCTKKSEEPAGVESKNESSNIVAQTGDYVITREELEKRVMSKLSPEEYSKTSEQAVPVDAEAVLLEMTAEKIMIIEARKQNFTERESIREPIEQLKERELFNMLLRRCVRGRINVTESEIEEKLKAEPKIDRNRAKAILKKTKTSKLIDDYYSELYKRFNTKKVNENFSRAAEVHQRLLLEPKEPRRGRFIRTSQVKKELTEEEKSLVLAKHDYGEVTLTDWFNVLCDIAPPSRPRDLHTADGIERLLDMALKKEIFITEARLLGLDRDKNLLKQLKEEQDRRLLREMVNEKVKDIEGPTNEQEIIAYFNQNKEQFEIEPQLQVDQIWCEDLKTAQKARAELDDGKDFESVRQEHSLRKNSRPFFTSPSQEGMFFDKISKGDPNEIAGPLKGYFGNGFKWRVVKILKKKPAQIREYSSDMKEYVKRRMVAKQRKAALAKYRTELLEKYPYEIYADRIKDIDPLYIP